MSHSLEHIKSINHHLRHALEQIADGVLIVEATSRLPLGPKIVFANRATAAWTGYEKEDLIGQPVGMLYEPERLEALVQRLPRVAEAGRSFETTKDLVKKDQSRLKCRWTISAVTNKAGEAVNFILTLSQLPVGDSEEMPESIAEESSQPAESEDQQIEEGLEKSRVESLALLAGGIAHDFNNVLQTILSNLSLAKLETSPQSPGRQQIEDAIEATQSAQSLAQQILDFTKGRQPMVQVANLGDVIKQVAKLSTMGSKIRCDITTPEGIWGVEVDLRQIRQVIHNLMINACQSMPGGGVVQASVENVNVPGGNQLNLAAGPYAVLRVRDRGCGIPREKLARIFEPYYTTKKNGTGIGLATCRAIVQRHHGTMTVASKVNAGTEFTVFLPACVFEEDTESEPVAVAGAGSRRAEPEAQPAPAGSNGDKTGIQHYEGLIPGEGRVLVVDDQDNVREAAERLLNKLGYETIPATNGQEAVNLYRRHAHSTDPINAVLLDMTLPGGLSGFEVMEEIRKLDQNARVIATSGFFDDDAEDQFRRDGYVGILPKPYPFEKLSQKLAEAVQN